MLHYRKDGSLLFTLVVSSLSLVFLHVASAERISRDISSDYKIIGNSALKNLNSEIIELPDEIIAKFVDSSNELHREKRKAEDTKDAMKSPIVPSPVASRSTESNSNKINEPTKVVENTSGKRREALANEEEDEEDDDEDEDINEEASHQYKKRAGNESTLNQSSTVHRANRQGPKIWDQWGKWSSCSVSCGVGKLTRWRHCIAGGCSLGEKEAQFKTCTFAAC